MIHTTNTQRLLRGKLVDDKEINLSKKTRYSCPGLNCEADEFYCKENGSVKKSVFLKDGTAMCTLCGKKFNIPSGGKSVG